MRTVRTKVYKFEELNENAKQVAIENHRKDQEICLDFFNDYAKEQIEAAGFKGNIELQYSLNCSQGDGLSFSCDCFDKLNELFIEVLGANKTKTIDCIINELKFVNNGNDGRYCYASKSDIELCLNNYYVKSSQNIDELISKVEKKIQNSYIELCKNLENQGYKEIEEQQSDEYISSELIDNDYDFLVNGELFNL